MIAHVEKFRDLLLAESAITALVSTRVYGYRLPDGQGANQLTKTAAMFVTDTDKSRHMANAPMSALVLECNCFGPTPEAAAAIYRAVFDSLHNQQRKTVGGVMFNQILVGQSIALEHEPTRWQISRCEISAWCKS